MTEPDASGASGIRFDWMVLREAVFRDPGDDDQISIPAGTQWPAELGVDAALNDESTVCRVKVSLLFRLPVASQIDEPVVRVVYEGQFTRVGSIPMQLEEFARIQGPVIILPFAREAVASITSRTRFGQLLLNPMSLMSALVKPTTDARALTE